MANIVPMNPVETWAIRIEQANVAKFEQAYWILKTYKEMNWNSESLNH